MHPRYWGGGGGGGMISPDVPKVWRGGGGGGDMTCSESFSRQYVERSLKV